MIEIYGASVLEGVSYQEVLLAEVTLALEQRIGFGESNRYKYTRGPMHKIHSEVGFLGLAVKQGQSGPGRSGSGQKGGDSLFTWSVYSRIDLGMLFFFSCPTLIRSLLPHI